MAHEVGCAEGHEYVGSGDGRVFLAKVMGDNDRLPRKYLFTDHPKPKGFEFPEWRFAWLAALAHFEQGLPAWFKSAKFASVPERLMLKKYLEHLAVKTLEGRNTTIYRNLKKGKALDTGFGHSVTARRKFQKYYENLLHESEEFKQESAKSMELKAPLAKVEKTHEVYKGWMQAFKLSAGTVIEVVNFKLALDALIEAKGDKGDKVWGLVGTSADLATQIGEVAKAFYAASKGAEEVEEVLSKAAIGRLAAVAGVLGFVSGACDMREFSGKAGTATAQDDPGQAVGLGISAAGAAMVALGGGMALAWALSGEILFASSAGGPAGLVVGAIGSVIILTGCALVAWFRDNHYQSFTKLCCFGQDPIRAKRLISPGRLAALAARALCRMPRSEKSAGQLYGRASGQCSRRHGAAHDQPWIPRRSDHPESSLSPRSS